MPFARAMTDQIEQFKRTKKGQPQLPAELPSALHTPCVLEWSESDVWGMAGLPEFYRYLRKRTDLKIPQEWKPCFPKELPDMVVGACP